MKVIDLYKNKTTIQTFDDKNQKRVSPLIALINEKDWKTQNYLGAGVYWSINIQSHGKRSIAHTLMFQCIGLDCDVTKETDEKKKNVRLPEAEVRKNKGELTNNLNSEIINNFLN